MQGSESDQSSYGKRHGDTTRIGRAHEHGNAFVFCINNHPKTGFYAHLVTLDLHYNPVRCQGYLQAQQDA